MSTERGLLFIADIGGYTRFMRNHRMSLAHAQQIIGALLEAVVDASRPLTLVEVEGDAAFFYLPLTEGAGEPGTVARYATAMHAAFHSRAREFTALNLCKCDGCVQTGQLRLKFVAHVGEVARQRVKRSAKIAGFDVIVVHRMLKNTVPVPEYVLMSEPAFAGCDQRLRGLARTLRQELEGIGVTETYFIDMEAIRTETPPPPAATLGRRLRTTLGVLFGGMPYLLGLRRSRADVPGPAAMVAPSP